MILIPLIGGAAATRIGYGHGVWRAMCATGLAGLVFTSVSTRFNAEGSLMAILIGAAAFTMLGAMGAVLSKLIRRRQKR